MDVEAVAIYVLDRLMCTPEDRRAGLMTRNGFINHHVIHAYQGRTSGGDRLTIAFPTLAGSRRPLWATSQWSERPLNATKSPKAGVCRAPDIPPHAVG